MYQADFHDRPRVTVANRRRSAPITPTERVSRPGQISDTIYNKDDDGEKLTHNMDDEADFLHPSPQTPLLYRQSSRPTERRGPQVSSSTFAKPAAATGYRRVDSFSGSVQTNQTDGGAVQHVKLCLWEGREVTLSLFCVIALCTVLSVVSQVGALPTSEGHGVHFHALALYLARLYRRFTAPSG